MPPWSSFFAIQTDPSRLLPGQHDWRLVLLSMAIAILASTMALWAAASTAKVRSATLRQFSLWAGSLALGTGIWAMHFIGMLSFSVCTAVGYDVPLTAASLVPGITASWVALKLQSQRSVHLRELAVGGVLMGGGIGTMHYTGMAALRMDAALRYDPTLFLLSIVVAVALAMLALWIRFGLASRLPRLDGHWGTCIAGTVMGLAISGMHYTGMAGARFIGEPGPAGQGLSGTLPLALSIAGGTLVATLLAATAIGLTHYRDLVELLRAKEAKLQSILDTALDGIVVFDSHGVIAKANPAAARITGHEVPELLGSLITRLLEGDAPSGVPTGQQADLVASLARRTGQSWQTTLLHRDGHPVTVRMALGQTRLGNTPLYTAYITDISAQVKTESALKASESQFRTLIANMPGIAYRCEVAPGWPVRFLSDAVERITGHPAARFLGDDPALRLADLVPAEDVDQVAQRVRHAVANHEAFSMEFRLRHQDGSWRWMWGNGRLVQDEATGVRWMDGVLLDMTERRLMEMALLEAKDKAETAAQVRSSFLANMSHEIRTPMNAILGFTDIVLASELPADSRKHLDTVRRAARSLLHLLNDILDSSKLERGALELEQLHYSLPELLQQVQQELGLAAEKKQLGLRVELDPGLPAVLVGDPHRMRQVLVNLVGNAIKFTEQGGVTVAASQDDGHLLIEVRDTGIGIAEDRLPHIFDAFTQADASMSRRFGGTGLGTTISKQLVELMHGTIRVTSQLGQGSCFALRLPLKAGQAALQEHLLPRDVPTLPPLRILCVDDVPQNLELLGLMLRRGGHQVGMAADGREAVARVATQTWDVVLMDVQMPVMDGLQATRQIRASEAAQGLRRLPIIALSASVMNEDRQLALDAGMDGFAHKPVELDALLTEVARVCGLADESVPGPGDGGALPSGALAIRPGTDRATGLAPERIDHARALRRWGDASAYEDALRRWLAQPADAGPAPEPPADVAQAASQVHRIGGVAANLGLALIADVCAQLEAIGRREGRMDKALWQELRQAWQQTREDLAAWQAGLTQPSQPTRQDAQGPAPGTPDHEGMGDPDALRRMLPALIQRLRLGEAIDGELPALWTSAGSLVPSGLRQQLTQALDDFDHELAAQRLGDWLDTLNAPSP